MASNIVHLPNGQNLTVSPVFGGLFFKSNDLTLHSSVFPAGWNIIIHSEDYSDDHPEANEEATDGTVPVRRHHTHRYKHPTLNNDHLFISSISNPSNADFKPPASPTRQIAMMLFTTLYWYFHQPEPSLYIKSEASKNTPDAGKPKGEWRIHIKREGIFRGRNLLHKLERMGLISSEDSSVGSSSDERTTEGWQEMFVSRRTFWQLSAKLFLYTLAPIGGPNFGGSPYGSRPNSPVRNSERRPESRDTDVRRPGSPGLWTPQTPGPFASGSHLPTYYPPPPLQYTISNGVRHPIRPKPPRQGETFYVRYIPSIGQYLSFRVASICDRAVAYSGPVSRSSSNPNLLHALSALPSHVAPLPKNERSSSPTGSDTRTPVEPDLDTTEMTDVQLLHKWMNIPRVSKFWGCNGPIATQEKFLKTSLESRHSFPAIGCWDGKPFGFFEIYWVKEDALGKLLGGNEVGDYDRGIHVLVGEEEFRGKHRLQPWMSSLIHWAYQTDYRTNNFVLEPRVDNQRYVITSSCSC
jgi:hypothetical protein